ncbi:MAG: DegV family protein [Oscillospiraceae bacterium]|nr:DegV family protein [Oscillospiraceae bacterium]
MDKREYVIVTDSTCDMGEQYYEVNGITVIGLHYTIGSRTYTQGAHDELSITHFYERIRDGIVPKTSPVEYDDALPVLDKIAQEGKDIFYLAFSSAMGASYQNAQIAAEDVMAKYPECTIKVVDSLTAAGGEGLLLHLCVKKKTAGASLDDLVNYAERMKSHIVGLFTVDNLHHLQRGGRLSKFSAVVGSIMHVKPLLHVDASGGLSNYAKVKGRKKSLETLAEHMNTKYLPGENDEVFIIDADNSADAEFLGNLVTRKMPDVKRIRYCKIGPVIGAHTGADTIGIFFIGKNRNPIEE